MGKNGIKGFILSFICHSTLAATLYLRWDFNPPKLQKPIFTVTLKESEENKNKLNSQTSNELLNKIKKVTKINHLLKKDQDQVLQKHKKFRVKDYSPKSYQNSTFQESYEQKNNNWAKDDVMYTMNEMSLPEYSNNRNFFEAFGSRINAGVLYPKELWEHHISGKVWLKIKVDKQGRLIQLTEVSQLNPVLRAYILINIYQSLKEPLPKRFWYNKEEDLNLYLKFDYKTSSIPTMKEQQSFTYYKNQFQFIRVGKISNFLQEAMKDYARYIPPIVPTPLGPVVDFVRLYYLINAWVEEDPLKKKRNRLLMTKEKMHQLLDISKEKHQSSIIED